MAYDITLLPEREICIITLQEGWDAPQAVEERAQATQRILEEAETPIFLVMDLSQIKMTIDGVVRSANRLARGPDAPFHHPMCRGVALVTTERIARMVARGLQTETFGNLRVCVCSTIEEALNEAT